MRSVVLNVVGPFEDPAAVAESHGFGNCGLWRAGDEVAVGRKVRIVKQSGFSVSLSDVDDPASAVDELIRTCIAKHGAALKSLHASGADCTLSIMLGAGSSEVFMQSVVLNAEVVALLSAHGVGLEFVAVPVSNENT